MIDRDRESRLFRWFRGFAVSRGCAGSVAAGFGWCAREISRLFHSISFPHSHTHLHAREHAFFLLAIVATHRYPRCQEPSHTYTHISRENSSGEYSRYTRLGSLVCSLSCALSRSLACVTVYNQHVLARVTVPLQRRGRPARDVSRRASLASDLDSRSSRFVSVKRSTLAVSRGLSRTDSLTRSLSRLRLSAYHDATPQACSLR